MAGVTQDEQFYERLGTYALSAEPEREQSFAKVVGVAQAAASADRFDLAAHYMVKGLDTAARLNDGNAVTQGFGACLDLATMALSYKRVDDAVMLCQIANEQKGEIPDRAPRLAQAAHRICAAALKTDTGARTVFLLSENLRGHYDSPEQAAQVHDMHMAMAESLAQKGEFNRAQILLRHAGTVPVDEPRRMNEAVSAAEMGLQSASKGSQTASAFFKLAERADIPSPAFRHLAGICAEGGLLNHGEQMRERVQRFRTRNALE